MQQQQHPKVHKFVCIYGEKKINNNISYMIVYKIYHYQWKNLPATQQINEQYEDPFRF